MPKSRSKSSFSRYRPYAKAAMSLASKFFRGSAKRIATKVNKGPGDYGGVTSQYDKKVQYVRKSAPKRIKRKYKRIAKNAKWAQIKQLGQKTLVRNGTVSNSWGVWTNATSQRVAAVALYGLNGAAPAATIAGFSDVNSIAANDANFDEKTEAILFTSAVLDITFRNTSAAMGLEVDMYEIIFKGQNSGPDIITDYNQALGDLTKQAPGAGAGTLTDLTNRGVTPFEASLASSRGYVVMKKTKYFVPAGNTFTFQHRDPRNHFLQNQYYANQANSAQWRWKTYNLLFIAKPVAGTADNTVGGFTIGVTRKYGYKVIEDNKDEGMLIAS